MPAAAVPAGATERPTQAARRHQPCTRHAPAWARKDGGPVSSRLRASGRYSRACCPEYLKPAQFAALKGGLVERVSTHTLTITDFLRAHEGRISRFVLLDHMDWMSSYYPEALAEEWSAIFDKAAPGARILLRSAHSRPPYLERLRAGALHFQHELAHTLQAHDRVHTYPGFVIADVPA